ncbi:hypothetical protein VTL71DRAFT_7232 [Oculimacula yallundae]|uniref:Heterokaryon incompatibility domain-containing protein n=1 Tax=Oculimacula yallundae TaxID=86028 RepID=A0ABR4BW39_9HELO
MDEDEDSRGLPVLYDGESTHLCTSNHSTMTSVTSTQSIESIKLQMKECLETHGSNCPSKFEVGLPTRVIDVDSDTNSERLSLHIREPRERSQYAALSYCWGSPPHTFMTTTDLIRDPSQRDWSRLPSTIRDAIWVTRALGLRYLWVDSLCIIQDDESDKMKEIQLMGTIYKNARVTIAAARSLSVYDGFLQEIHVPQICLPFIDSDGNLRKLWVHAEPPELPDEPLEKRGWTLQESLLSPRILYYGSKDLVWKCRVEPFRSMSTHHAFYRPPIHERLPQAVFNIPSRDPIVTESIWLRIQAAFLYRHFKLSQDRYFALTGIAHELQRISGDIYIAGMWKSTIMRQLSWKRTDNIVSCVQAQEPLSSPSWSWLALFRPLITLSVDSGTSDENHPILMSWSVNLADESAPLGYVLGGRLDIVATIVNSIDASSIDSGPGVLTLDWNVSKDDAQSLGNFIGKDFVYMYLGRKGHDRLGLLLCRLEDGSFVRWGHLIFADSVRGPWENPLAQRTELSLV